MLNFIAISTGITFVALTYVFGPCTGHYTLLNSNIALMIFLLTWGHLRHSHLWIPLRGIAGRLLQSPAHHQIHHSTDPRHFDKNLGFALAVWDWVFGTLYIPAREREVIEFGLGAEGDRADYATVTRSIARPFVRAGERLAPSPVADVSGQHG